MRISDWSSDVCSSDLQAREDMNAVAHDGEVVKATTVFLPAILDHPDASPLGAIIGRQFFQANHPMSNAVHGLVQGFGGQVIEQQHRGVVAHKIMLDRQNLAAIDRKSVV